MSVCTISFTAKEVDSLCALVGRCRYAEILWRIMGGARSDGTMQADLSEEQVSELRLAVEEQEEFLTACGGALAAKITSLLHATCGV
jgi:hypothetical protein